MKRFVALPTRLASSSDPPTVAGVLFVVLLLSSDLTFRRRDPTLAVQGHIDAAIVVELAIWAAVLVWLAVKLFPGARLRFGNLQDLGPGLSVLLVVSALFLATSFYAGGMLPVVRGVQFMTMAGLGLLAYQRAKGDAGATMRFWNAVRRSLWILVAAAVPIGLALAQVFPDFGAEIVPGEGPRYQLFRTHPITTGGLIGLSMVALAGGWLASPDPWFRRRAIRWLGASLFATFTLLLLATKARGALFATLTALAILALFTHHKQRRGVVVLVGAGAIALFLAGVGVQLLREVVIRGQTTEQLRSMTGRTRLFEVGYQLFLERPFFGHGYHAARSIYLEQVPWAGHSHNAWVEVGVNTGAVGLILVLCLFVRLGMVMSYARRAGPPQQQAWSVEALAFVLFVLVLGMVSPGFAGAPGYELAALVWAVLLADLSVTRESRVVRLRRSRHMRPPL